MQRRGRWGEQSDRKVVKPNAKKKKKKGDQNKVKGGGASGGWNGGGKGDKKGKKGMGQGRARESKHVWNVPLVPAVRNACQPRIRLLHAATDWQLACGLDYTLEWLRLNKGNA